MTIRTPHKIADDAEAVRVIPDHALLNTHEAAEFLRLLGRPFTFRTLETYRAIKPDAIRFRKLGHSVRYVAGDLRRFANGEA